MSLHALNTRPGTVERVNHPTLSLMLAAARLRHEHALLEAKRRLKNARAAR